MSASQLPDQMLAIAISDPGGPEVLTPTQVDTPRPGLGQVLIKVAAAGINRPDVLQRQGHYPAPEGASPLPGLEVSGTIAECGPGAHRYKEGDRVCALVHGGGYAEYCVAEESATLPIPEQLNFIDAAGVPETAFTVWHNTFERGQLKPGEWFLVHGGSSGIGSTAIQLAAAWGAKVITTVSSKEKAEFCSNLGADHVINYHEEDYVQKVKEITDKRGASVILDMIGGDYIERNIKCAAEDGRIVQIAFLNGPIAEVNFALIMIKRLTVTGSTLRARSNEVKAEIAKAVETHVWPMIDKCEFKPVIDSVFPLSEAAEAHRRMESREHMGKIILTT